MIKITQTRQQAINSVAALTEESSKKEIIDVFSLARKAFARVKSFEAVESAAWDMILAGGCHRVVYAKLFEFNKNLSV